MTRLFFSLVFLPVIFLSGCSPLSGAQRTEPNLGDDVPGSVLGSKSQAPVAPFSLAVSQELNDGERLLVVAKLKAEGSRSVEDLLIRLRAFSNGVQVGETMTPVKQTVASLSPGEIKEIPLILTAKDVTDYQLDLAWGEESPVAKALSPDGLAPGMAPELSQVSVTAERVNCGAKACELRYTLAGLVMNLTDRTINEVVLGTGFIWQPQNLDLAPKVPENEAVVEVKNMALAPGDSKKIRLVLDQTVPERSDGAFRPVLRIASFR